MQVVSLVFKLFFEILDFLKRFFALPFYFLALGNVLEYDYRTVELSIFEDWRTGVRNRNGGAIHMPEHFGIDAMNFTVL